MGWLTPAMEGAPELIPYYSNTPDLLSDLRLTLQAVTETTDQEDDPDLPLHPSDRPWRVQDRLSEEDIQTLIKVFQVGMSKPALAARYSISLSAVKRLLRQHHIRRDSRSDTLP
jgi:hypothetical protein